IKLTSALKISKGDVTIAGQSAPGDGICIGNYPVSVAADNVIIRYIRFRMGGDVEDGDGADALGGRFFKNVIVDHCSVSWSTDECVSFYNCDYFTLQWCMITESLRLSAHSKGPHGYGGIWGGTNSSFHHNLLAHHDSRTPRFGPGQNIPAHTETTDYRNNVNYNYGNTYGGEAMCINMVNNYYKPGPSSMTGSNRGRIMSIDKDSNTGSIRYNTWGQFYVNGNVVDDGKGDAHCKRATENNWTYGVFNQFNSGYGTVSAADKEKIRMSAPHLIWGLSDNKPVAAYVSTHEARMAYEKVLEYAGTSLKRDSYDQRIIQEVKAGTTTFKGLSKYNGYTNNYPGSTTDWRSKNYPKLGIIDSHWDIKPDDAGDDWTPWPILAEGTVPVDSNRDGIPDDWKAEHCPDNNARDKNEEGYTYVEVYLNSLVEEITTKQNEGATRTEMSVNIDEVKPNILRAYYDSEAQTIVVNADEPLLELKVYSVAGVLIADQAGDDLRHGLNIPANSAGVLIIKALTTNKQALTAKVMI
ncbi:pectate lyase, partial [Bacteroidales bacterium OttesenSCG-928-L03]|nr:pectate lyase [Bacteroidales bacterium OttesenSCG-928-L03]